MSINPYHVEFDIALRDRSYRSIIIKRMGKECFLVVDIDGTPHVFLDKWGNKKITRHAWQIKEWLETEYSISKDEVSVETIC